MGWIFQPGADHAAPFHPLPYELPMVNMVIVHAPGACTACVAA
jgi:hypothetical protein